MGLLLNSGEETRPHGSWVHDVLITHWHLVAIMKSVLNKAIFTVSGKHPLLIHGKKIIIHFFS